MLTNRLGNSHPITYNPESFESIETIPIVFAAAYLDLVTFHNYRDTYNTASCANNYAFITNEYAAEAVPPHYL